MNGSVARDGRTTIRIIFANGIDRILAAPSGPNGRMADSKVLAMREYEATALAYIRSDQAFIDEIRWIEDKGLKGDEATLARWTAVIAALARAELLDRSNVPIEDYGGSSSEEAEGAAGADAL